MGLIFSSGGTMLVFYSHLTPEAGEKFIGGVKNFGVSFRVGDWEVIADSRSGRRMYDTGCKMQSVTVQQG
jgi:hypothetical protein